MKTFETHYRIQLEGELLAVLLQYPDRLNHFNFWESDFQDLLHKKVWNRIKELKEINQEISPVTVLKDFDKVSEFIRYFSADVFHLSLLGPFTEAAKKLREDTVRHLLFRQIEQCGDSVEYMNFVETMRNAGVAYTLESFEKELEKYSEEYKLREAQMKEHATVGLVTGWSRFSEKVCLMPNDFIVLGARTSVGKTAFALNLAIDLAAYQYKVLFVSMEMNRQSIFDRMFANLLKENSGKFKYAKIPLEQIRKEAEVVKDHFFFVHAPTATTDIVENLASKAHFDLIVVDYLQLLKDKASRNETENTRLGRVSSKLKAIAGNYKTVVLSPAQLNRDSEKHNRKPNLSDLRDSGCIEQDADTVLLLHRENREVLDTELIIAKNRNGALGTVDFIYNPAQNIFKENPIYT